MTNYTFTDDTLADIHRLAVDALESLDYATANEFEKRSRGQVLADSIASAQRMVEFCNDSARQAHHEVDSDQWFARAWEYRLELEALKHIEFIASLVESASSAQLKADASWRDSLAVNN